MEQFPYAFTHPFGHLSLNADGNEIKRPKKYDESGNEIKRKKKKKKPAMDGSSSVDESDVSESDYTDTEGNASSLPPTLPPMNDIVEHDL